MYRVCKSFGLLQKSLFSQYLLLKISAYIPETDSLDEPRLKIFIFMEFQVRIYNTHRFPLFT